MASLGGLFNLYQNQIPSLRSEKEIHTGPFVEHWAKQKPLVLAFKMGESEQCDVHLRDY